MKNTDIGELSFDVYSRNL